MRALTAALGIGAVFLATGASAQTINDRLTAVEKKTGYFKIARVKKSWHRSRMMATRNPSTRDAELHLSAFTPVPSDNPVISNAWWTVDVTYSSTTPFQFAFNGTPGCPVGGPLFPAGTAQTIHRKVFCQGVVNVQEDGALHIGWSIDAAAAGDATLDDIQLHVHTVNQVITEPPE